MQNPVRTPAELMRDRERMYIETKRLNKEELTKFFMAAYAVEQDPYHPMTLEEAFPGINIPDIRKEGSRLEDLWPHYIIPKLSTEPGYEAYRKGSPEFVREFNDIVALIRAMKARADEVNAEADRICKDMLTGKI